MDSLEKTLTHISLEFIDKLFLLPVQVTLKVSGAGIQVYKDENGNLNTYKGNGTLSRFGTPLDEIPQSIQELPWDIITEKSLLIFVLLGGEPLLIGAVKDLEILEISDIKKLAQMLKVLTVPVVFEGKLSEEQKNTIRKWCRMTREQKLRLLGSSSFCRFFITLMTGGDPVEIPFVLDVNGIIEGFVFTFYNSDTVYFSKLLDPHLAETTDEEIPGNADTINPEDILSIFLRYYDKYGFIIAGDNILERNFLKVLDNTPAEYNNLIELIARCRYTDTSIDNEYLDDMTAEFTERCEKNELIKRLFTLFLDVFGKQSDLSFTISSEILNQANKYIAKINK